MKLRNDSRRGARLILNRGDVLALEPGRRAVQLACVAGCLYVTQTDDTIDHILKAGESFQSAPRGKIVVTSFTCSTVEVGDASVEGVYVRNVPERSVSASPAIAPPTTMIHGLTFQTMRSRKAASPSAKSALLRIELVQTGA